MEWTLGDVVWVARPVSDLVTLDGYFSIERTQPALTSFCRVVTDLDARWVWLQGPTQDGPECMTRTELNGLVKDGWVFRDTEGVVAL